jgi:hypothetical protein
MVVGVVMIKIIDMKVVKVWIILMHLEAEGKFQYCLCQFVRGITLGGKFFKNFPLYRVLIEASVLSRMWYLL